MQPRPSCPSPPTETIHITTNSPTPPIIFGSFTPPQPSSPPTVDPNLEPISSNPNPNEHNLDHNATTLPSHSMITRSTAGIFKPKLYLTEASKDGIPSTVDEALSSPEWKEATLAEYNALLKHGTWTLVTPPSDCIPVGCKWIFKLKHNADGTISRHKARLVAKGFSQLPGTDFVDTFSSVVKFHTIIVILSITTTNNWPLRHVDINNAFLYGDLQEDVYMLQPPGFETVAPDGSKLVCKLHKALYGLRQAPRSWNSKLRDCLLNAGFRSSGADTSLYIRHLANTVTYVLTYVDDIMITSCSNSSIDNVVSLLAANFSLKDLSALQYFLGLEVSRTPTNLFLCQRKYTSELLSRSHMDKAKGASTPMLPSDTLTQHAGSLIEDASGYRSTVGSLLYLCHTRPDITYSVYRVAQYMHHPYERHLVAVKRVLRYLAATLHFGMVFKPSTQPSSLVAFADADWGSCPDDRRSTTGNCVYLGNNIVAWTSKKQKVVSRSTMEAEYRSIADTASEITWLRALLHDLGIKQAKPPIIWSDSISAVALSINPVFHAQSKHVNLDVHFIRERVTAKDLVINYVPAPFQTADGFTKPLTTSFFTLFQRRLNVVQLEDVLQETKK
ncbi:cysteine-rich RLK (RECEPTOR-like protein kinase) 8 [Hibiscus trionum]|uniref:Cysteine-rich RLK (RECEPTOR-like protein kinase) 8 n=1 Tax=Hibiscus trionum TaxID=183268 RepID=A0A9W7MEV2_HIBTR|nr:cysteine-rich RLK (RECEPTOR-like protein kinase) 8 [Hibiscus trionum]